ncbi:MAG: response regulator [Myxococcota bacterium]
MVEDDEVDRMAMRRALKRSEIPFVLEEAADLRQSDGHIAGGELDCILLDLRLPDGDGFSLLDRARAEPESWPPLIVLTGVDDTPTGIEAMRRGAEDYLVKGQVSGDQLVRAIRYAIERHRLRRTLADRVRELEELMERVQTLEGLLPMCSWCKSIRDNENYWLSVEEYLEQHSEATFSHGICPKCYEAHIEPELKDGEGPRSRGRRFTPRDVESASSARRTRLGTPSAEGD